jgi:hypothetical protein
MPQKYPHTIALIAYMLRRNSSDVKRKTCAGRRLRVRIQWRVMMAFIYVHFDTDFHFTLSKCRRFLAAQIRRGSLSSPLRKFVLTRHLYLLLYNLEEMKTPTTKKNKEIDKDELRPEYKRADFPGGFVRGKYAKRLKDTEMNHDIRQIIEQGENSLVEFKETSVSPQTLAEEIVAFES